jgi:very-short-patch-repair endonuclease
MLTKLYNNREQTKLRTSLRQSMPKGERLLWSKLRAGQTGYKFKRQYGIGKYIVDFYAPLLKLIIEVDGRTHDYDDQVAYDKERQKYLESLSIKIKRFNSKEIFDNIDSVVEQIWLICENIKNHKN